MYNVLGVQNVDYVSRKTNNPVTGIRLHLGYERKGCDGICVDSFFCRHSCFSDGLVPVPGDHVNLLFNRYGNVEEVHLD